MLLAATAFYVGTGELVIFTNFSVIERKTLAVSVLMSLVL